MENGPHEKILRSCITMAARLDKQTLFIGELCSRTRGDATQKCGILNFCQTIGVSVLQVVFFLIIFEKVFINQLTIHVPMPVKEISNFLHTVLV